MCADDLYPVLLRGMTQYRVAAELGAQSYDSDAYLKGKPTVLMAIYQLPAANALALDKLVRAKNPPSELNLTQLVMARR